MHRSFLLLFLVGTLTAPVTSATVITTAVVEVGGPPSIRLAGKAAGDITRAQWNALSQVDLAGCVPTARIVSLKLCINDCQGKAAMHTATSGTLTPEMKRMITNLPSGMVFTVAVEVKDDTGRSWPVPVASYVLVN